MRLQKDKMLIDTAVLSLFSVGLQGLGLLFNVFLTRRLGSAAVGEMTLMTSFYALAAVLSGGSGFVAVSRFLAEELGCGGDPARIFRYVLRFCGVISSSVTAILFVSAPLLEAKFPDAGCTAIRILCLSLPVSAFTGCLKGRCYAFQRVYVPVIAEYAEFIVRSGVLAFAVVFLLPENRAGDSCHRFAERPHPLSREKLHMQSDRQQLSPADSANDRQCLSGGSAQYSK